MQIIQTFSGNEAARMTIKIDNGSEFIIKAVVNTKKVRFDEWVYTHSSG